MGVLSFIICLVLSFYCLWRFRAKTTINLNHLLIGWGIKLAASVSFILIFSHYYGNGNLFGDAFNFLNDSRIICEFGKSDPLNFFKLLLGIADEPYLFEHTTLAETNIWSYGENGDFINDNRLIIRFNALIHFISFGNVYVHALILTFCSYIGLLLIHRSFLRFIANPTLFFYTIIAFPSIAFWGSGITKESIMLFALGMFFYAFFVKGKKHLSRAIPLLLISGAILLFNKPHVGLVILTLSPFLVLGQLTQWHKNVRRLFPVAVITGTVLLTYAPSQINLLDKVSYKQRDLINMGKGGIFFVTDSSFCAFDYEYLHHFERQENKRIVVRKNTIGEYKLFGPHPFFPFEIPASNNSYEVYLVQPPSTSYIDVTPINYSRRNMFGSIPQVLQNTLIRPYPWDPGSALKIASFVSNLSLIALLIFAFFNRKKLTSKERFIIAYFVISTVALLLIIGWTTPILGAIARYKIAAELLILIGISMALKPLKR